MQINIEIFQTPILFCSLSLITEILNLKSINGFNQVGMLLGFFLIILQILFGLFLHFHQTDYRIKNYDILGKVQGLQNHVLYALRLFIIFLSGSQSNTTITQIVGLLINSMQTVQHFRLLTYIDHRIRTIAFNINTLMVIYQLILIICQQVYPTIKVSTSLSILLLYPFALFLIYQLSNRIELLYHFIDQKQYLRRLYQTAKIQVQILKRQQNQDQQKVFEIYTVVRSHLQQCKQIRIRKMLKIANFKEQCFCQTLQKQNESIQSLEFCKEFLKQLLGQVLQDELKENSNFQKILTYIYYLTEIKKAPISAIYEIIRISNFEHIPLRFQQIIHQLQQNSLQLFNQLIKKQNLVNQTFDFKKAYLFEESLQILKQNFFHIVKQEIEFYETLFTSIIDTKSLEEKGILLVSNIKLLEYQIQLVFRVNPQNGECDTIYKLFQKYINYNKIRPKLYRREGQLTAEFIQSLDKIIYDQNSCVVQITLLQPRGNIIKYTRSFQQVVQCKDDEIMNQNIKKFIPSIIANDHDLYLDNFVETGRINVLKKELRIILVKLNSQFVIPINTRLRIEINPVQFGAQALMTPVNQSYGYLMLNEQGQIEEITKNLYEYIFKQYLGLELDWVRGLDFLLLIPQLSSIWQSLFDENFDKLDYYLDGQLMFPVIEKQIISPTYQFNYGNKLLLNKRLEEYMKNNSQTLIKYQINCHLTSLTTINLRVVIVEIPEYKQMANRQATSQLELNSVKPPKTQMNITNQSDLPTHKSYGINSPLNTPHPSKTLMNECDLDYENLDEEKKMIDEFRNQLASITMNNTIQNNTIQINQKEPLIQQKQLSSSEIKIIIPQNVISFKSDEFEQKQFQQDLLFQQQQYDGSVGSRSSQNNSNSFKMQIRECLKESQMNLKIKAFLIIFYLLLITGYVVNFCILQLNLQEIDKNLNFDGIPYQLSYYYNEFVIANVYQQQDEFQFDQLSQASIDYYKQHQKYIDEAVILMPQINIINGQTLRRRINNILSQMSQVYDTNQSIILSDYLNNSYAFHSLLDTFEDSNSPQQISSLLYFFISEEIILLLLLSSYAYFYISILQMKIAFYKLFCTLSKDFVKEQFIQFHSLYIQINHSKFKSKETNEESFEASMISQFQKNSTQGNLENQVRIGKQVQNPQMNTNLIIFILMLFILMMFSSFYYFGTYLLQNQTLSQIQFNYVERVYYENLANHLTFAYSHQAIFYNKTISEETIEYQNKVIEDFQILISEIITKSEKTSGVINTILFNEICIIFQEAIFLKDNNYQKLFSYDQCQSVASLQKGLIFTSQELYSIYNDIIQDSKQGMNSKYDHFLQINIQIQRLYSQYSFQVIIEALENDIKYLISYTLQLNILMFVLANILAIVALLIAKYFIENAKQQYMENKKILALFPYERLTENAYIHSFIMQDLRFHI